MLSIMQKRRVIMLQRECLVLTIRKLNEREGPEKSKINESQVGSGALATYRIAEESLESGY